MSGIPLYRKGYSLIEPALNELVMGLEYASLEGELQLSYGGASGLAEASCGRCGSFQAPSQPAIFYKAESEGLDKIQESPPSQESSLESSSN